jgi:hypothetical protein
MGVGRREVADRIKLGFTLIMNYELTNYQFFHRIFKQCNVGFGFPRADICGACEEFNVKIKSTQNETIR